MIFFFDFVCSNLMFFALKSFHFVSDYFLVTQSVFKFIKLSRNIYFWNLLSNTSFILPISFLMVGLKIFWIVTEMKQMLAFKKFFKNVF